MSQATSVVEPERLDDWDPLATTDASDPGLIVAAQRREIRNILRSYTGYYDLFSEMLQNALDAVERRARERELGYKAKLWLRIDMATSSVSVTDNGCGMSLAQFKSFLRPSLSFKDGANTRGSKGVGATYLGYGFNQLEVATKHEGKTYAGILKYGRQWVDDTTETIIRPMVETHNPTHEAFVTIDRGTSMTVRLTGKDVRPKNLGWIGAVSADTWLPVLQASTPLGGIYTCGDAAPDIEVNIEVVPPSGGEKSFAVVEKPRYLYPHDVIKNVADLRDFLKEQKRRVEKGLDVSKPPPRFQKLNGIWGEWTGEQMLDPKSGCPISPRLDEDEQKLVRELGVKLYIFLAFSTDLWDYYSNKELHLRTGQRLLHGGLQLATRHMPQGSPLTIPMTNNIGFQNLAHVIIHFENAEPDLGRKGFQPDQVHIAEKLSVSAVTAFRNKYDLLRKPGGTKAFGAELKISNWIRSQEQHEIKCPLKISGKGLFMPTEELPIRSEPIVEQDVVALFNQMLSSGLIRGLQLISSSQFKQYDGLYRVRMEAPYDKYLYSDQNPLGIERETFQDADVSETTVKVLEYKFSVNGLIEELQGDVKSTEDIGLVVAWEMGNKWKELFTAISYLDSDNRHHRIFHGTTHSFTHSMSGARAFEVIILRDLVNFLHDPTKEEERQKKVYSEDAGENA